MLKQVFAAACLVLVVQQATKTEAVFKKADLDRLVRLLKEELTAEEVKRVFAVEARDKPTKDDFESACGSISADSEDPDEIVTCFQTSIDRIQASRDDISGYEAHDYAGRMKAFAVVTSRVEDFQEVLSKMSGKTVSNRRTLEDRLRSLLNKEAKEKRADRDAYFRWVEDHCGRNLLENMLDNLEGDPMTASAMEYVLTASGVDTWMDEIQDFCDHANWIDQTFLIDEFERVSCSLGPMYLYMQLFGIN